MRYADRCRRARWRRTRATTRTRRRETTETTSERERGTTTLGSTSSSSWRRCTSRCSSPTGTFSLPPLLPLLALEAHEMTPGTSSPPLDLSASPTTEAQSRLVGRTSPCGCGSSRRGSASSSTRGPSWRRWCCPTGLGIREARLECCSKCSWVQRCFVARARQAGRTGKEGQEGLRTPSRGSRELDERGLACQGLPYEALEDVKSGGVTKNEVESIRRTKCVGCLVTPAEECLRLSSLSSHPASPKVSN